MQAQATAPTVCHDVQGAHDLGRYARWFETDEVFVEEKSVGEDLRRYRLHPRLGRGWMEMRQIGSGLVIGRSAVCMERPFHYSYEWTPDAAGFGMLLSGSMELHMPQQQHRASAVDSEVLVRAGDMGRGYSISHAGLVSGVSIDLPPQMARTLREEGVQLFCHGARALLPGSAECTARLRALALRMLSLPAIDSTIHRLAQESMALELLTVIAGLETSKARPRAGHARWQAALDAAVDILHAEWDQPHTIASLARRVGMNDCYLKSMFRERTGEGIAGYLRGLRMQKARRLIEQGGCTVQQAALMAGYANPSQFAAAFRRAHGMLPSQLRGA